MQNRFPLFLLVSLAGALGACAPEVVPATSHPALDMAQVKIYQAEPAKYEKLGPITLTVQSTEHWEKTADATPAFEQLRTRAAAMGANGILLVDEEHKEYTMAGASYQGGHYLVPVRRDPLTVAVEAIFVLKE
jgi:hypothetical protein